eukprot:gene35943-52821_t
MNGARPAAGHRLCGAQLAWSVGGGSAGCADFGA